MSYQKFTKDVGLIGSANLLIALRSLIVLPVITKLLGAENYGIWAQIVVTISLMASIATLGLPYTLVRFLAAEKNKRKIQEGIYSVLTIILAIALLIVLILILYSDPVSDFFGTEQALIKILALIILLECLNMVFLNIFRAFQEMGKYSTFIIFQTFGEIGLIVAMVLTGYGLLGAVLSLLVIRFINFLIMGSSIIKKIGIKIPKFSRIKEYLQFGLPTVPSNISHWIVQSSDRYLIGFFLGAAFVGYYAPAYLIGSSLNLFIVPLAFILPAVLSKFFDENKISEVKTYLKYSLKYFLMIAIPAFFGLSILSEQLLTIFSTPEIAKQSYFIVPFVAASILLFGAYTVITQILSFKKKTKIVGTIWIAAAFLNFGLNLILIPKFGIMGAAITTLISYFLAFLLAFYYSFHFFKFEIDWRFILKSIFASILMSLFIYCASPIGLIKTLFTIISGATLYGFLIFCSKGLDKKEILFFIRLFKKNI